MSRHKTITCRAGGNGECRSLDRLVLLFEDEAKRARERMEIYRKKGCFERQRQCTEGQLAAFTAAAKWIRHEAQNDKDQRPRARRER